MRRFSERVGLPCVTLLGSQLAPEDIIGLPQIVDGRSRFRPPTLAHLTEHPNAMPSMGGVELSRADLEAAAAPGWALGHELR